MADRFTTYELRHVRDLLREVCTTCFHQARPLPTYTELAWRLGLMQRANPVMTVYNLLRALRRQGLRTVKLGNQVYVLALHAWEAGPVFPEAAVRYWGPAQRRARANALADIVTF